MAHLKKFFYLEVWQLGDARPNLLVGRAEDPENAEELVNLWISLEDKEWIQFLKQRNEIFNL